MIGFKYFLIPADEKKKYHQNIMLWEIPETFYYDSH